MMSLPEAIQPEDVANFQRGAAENRLFWARFGEKPDLQSATVLDVGSGWGCLCVEMAQAGAARVVGLDLKTHLVDFANAYLMQVYPELVQRVKFQAIDLKDFAEPVCFDLIVSKDSFEHILDLDGMLREMRLRLKPGGRIYAGFGPLYPTPYGDHDRRETIFRHWGVFGRLLAWLPWGHLVLEPLIVKTYNSHADRKITSLYDLGLNKLAASDYLRLFQASGLRVVGLRLNQSQSLQSRLFSVLRHVPGLEDYCTHSLYCILEKPAT